MSQLVDLDSSEFKQAVKSVLKELVGETPPESQTALMLQAHLESFGEFRNETRQRFDANAQDIGELKQDVRVLKTDVSTLKTDVSGLKQDMTGLRQDVSALEKNMNQQFMNLINLIKKT